MSGRLRRWVIAAVAVGWITTVPLAPASAAGNVWEEVAPLPVAVMGSGATEAGGRIYVGGGDVTGCCASVPTPLLQVYDPVANAWNLERPMPTSRRGAAAAAVGSHVYFIGGDLGGPQNYMVSNKVERFDAATGTWLERAPLPTPRAGAGAAAVGGKIYVIGGWLGAGKPSTNVMEIYDPATNSWAVGPSMPVSQHEFATVVLGSRILVIGGNSGSFQWVLAFDTQTQSWSLLAPLLHGRRSLGAAAVSPAGPVYAFGGTDPQCGNPAQAEQYDPATNTWRYVASLPFGRYSPSGAAAGGFAYVIGGTNNPGCGAAPPLAAVMRYLPLSCEGVPPKLAALITGKTGTRASRTWTIALSNVGECPATAAQIDGVVLTQTYGSSCTPRIKVPASFPLGVGDIPAGGRVLGGVTFDFTGCPTAARFTAKIGFSANGGAVGSKTLYNQYR